MTQDQRTITIERDGYDFDLRDHGVPVTRGLALSLKVCPATTTGERIYVGINAEPFVLVSIDPVSGRCQQYFAEAGGGPWGMALAPDGRVVLTTVAGHVCVFDPARPEAGVKVVAKVEDWFWTIAHAGGGVFFIGGNPNCTLYQFTLSSGELELLSRVDATQTSLRTIVIGSDGYLYGSIGCTAAQVVARRLSDGVSAMILPEVEATNGFHTLGHGRDGAVYVRCTTGHLYRLQDAIAQRIELAEFPGFVTENLASGDAVAYTDPDMLRIGEGDRARQIHIEYQTRGAPIFHIAPGPDSTGRPVLYGSSIMPLYLFRYDPATGESATLGRGAPETGEIYSFGERDGKLYYATYGGEGSFLVYDPAQPWQPGKGFHDWHHNPRVISVLGEGHCRPRAMCIDNRNRVWVGSYAEYGKHNGGLFRFDIDTGRIENNPVVVRNQSICSLTDDPAGRMVFGGTDTTPGSGAAVIEKEAKVFAWDADARRVSWEIVPVEGETGITNLIHHKGLLYGTTRPKGAYFIVDPAQSKVIRLIPSPMSDASEQSMGLASDGNFYGTTWPSLFRWRPGVDGAVETLCVVWGDEAKRYGGAIFRGGGAVIGDRIYFRCGVRLLSMRLPLER